MSASTPTPEAGQDERRSAVVSADGVYRYELRREWALIGRNMLFVMLNPSTADGTQDDPTIRRCMGFARREGCSSLTVVNLYAYRATKPADLWDAGRSRSEAYIVGPENHRHQVACREEADLVVLAWGAGVGVRGLPPHAASLYREALCLGRTKGGHPRHPLYVRADEPLVRAS